MVGSSRPTNTAIGVPLGVPQRPNPRSQIPPPSQIQTNSSKQPATGTPLAQNPSQLTPIVITTLNTTQEPPSTSNEPQRAKRKRKSLALEAGGNEQEAEHPDNVDEDDEEAPESSKGKGAKKPRAKSTGVKRPRKSTRTNTPAGSAEPENDDEDEEATPAPRKRTRRARSKAVTLPYDVNADPGADIDPNSITMAALCEDTGQGRVSSKAAEILTNHENWKKDRRERRTRMRELMERKKYGLPEDEDEAGAAKGKGPATKGDEETSVLGEALKASEEAVTVIEDDTDASGYGNLQHSRFNVQVRIGPNGETIIDEESLVVDRVEGGEQGEGEYEKVVESDMTKFTNSGTYGKRFRGSRWSKIETELFYDVRVCVLITAHLSTNIHRRRYRNMERITSSSRTSFLDVIGNLARISSKPKTSGTQSVSIIA